MHATLPSPMRATCLTHLILLYLITWGGVQVYKFLNMQFPAIYCDFLPLRPKYIRQHPTLQHHKPVSVTYSCIFQSLLFWTANAKTKVSGQPAALLIFKKFKFM
jgi:hypothetical protein